MFFRFISTCFFFLLFQTSAFSETDLSKLDSAQAIHIRGVEGMKWPASISGKIYSEDQKPLAGVSVVYNENEYFTDENGVIEFKTAEDKSEFYIRTSGFRKVILDPQANGWMVNLEKQDIRAIYVQSGVFKNGAGAIMKNVNNLLKTTELNALVIDFKDDEGRLSSVETLKPLIKNYKARGVYLIARVVAFKDNRKPRTSPELAVLNKNTGKPWEDKNGVTYLNPFLPAAHTYLVSVAEQAVRAGFDEIQYDYVRFPTDGNRALINYSGYNNTSAGRSKAIAELLKAARKKLGALGAFLAADVFGITAYDSNDSGIGQHVETITPYLDYVCPMVYPSGFAAPTGNVKQPVMQPGQIVYESLKRYRLRADADAVIRPWLQSFRDYSGTGKNYGGTEIRAQIDGAAKAKAIGFMLWNAGNKYSSSGLNPKAGPAPRLN